mmetsp:Transcript_81417/g.211664  ORF Transcript_81417/g.211664 Transcript_81417/m.211664 type:complete len:358 (-) Transcript_81417:21-1094(-)
MSRKMTLRMSAGSPTPRVHTSTWSRMGPGIEECAETLGNCSCNTNPQKNKPRSAAKSCTPGSTMFSTKSNNRTPNATLTATYSECLDVKFFMLFACRTCCRQALRNLAAASSSPSSVLRKPSKETNGESPWPSSLAFRSPPLGLELLVPVWLFRVAERKPLISRIPPPACEGAEADPGLGGTFGDDWMALAEDRTLTMSSSCSAHMPSAAAPVQASSASSLPRAVHIEEEPVKLGGCDLDRLFVVDFQRDFALEERLWVCLLGSSTLILAKTLNAASRGMKPSMSSSRKRKTLRNFFSRTFSVSSSFTRRAKALPNRGISEATRTILVNLLRRVAFEDRAAMRSNRVTFEERPARKA